MPLTRGRIGGHDNERLAFAFTMMNDDETVQCQISDAAMDEIAEVKGTPSIARQAQFVAHRDTIEKIASELFDKAPDHERLRCSDILEAYSGRAAHCLNGAAPAAFTPGGFFAFSFQSGGYSFGDSGAATSTGFPLILPARK